MGFVTLPSGEVVHASALGNAGRVIFGRIVAVDRRTDDRRETALVTVEVAQSMVDGLMILQKCDLLLPPPPGSAMAQQGVSSVEGAASTHVSTGAANEATSSPGAQSCKDLGPWEADEFYELGSMQHIGCLTAQGIFYKYSVTERNGKWIIICDHNDYEERWEYPDEYDTCEAAMAEANDHNRKIYSGIVEKWSVI